MNMKIDGISGITHNLLGERSNQKDLKITKSTFIYFPGTFRK